MMPSTPNSASTPMRPLSLFSRSSSLNAWQPSVRPSSGGSIGRARSVRLSAPPPALLRTPPSRPRPPLLPAFEPRPSSSAGFGRAELCAAVSSGRAAHLLLTSAVLRQREELSRLRDGLRETYEAAEKEGESMTNHLMRRVEAVRREKVRLEARLRAEEARKLAHETRLVALQADSRRLMRRVQREEEETVAPLAERLRQLQRQRRELEALRTAQAASVQRLQSMMRACPQPPPAPPGDAQEMLLHLRHEVGVVEGLRREAGERAACYEQQRRELERRISAAERERRSNRHSMEGIHQELAETTATTTELAAAAEMAMERHIERQLHECSRSRGESIASSSHGSLTPKQTPAGAEGEHIGEESIAMQLNLPPSSFKKGE